MHRPPIAPQPLRRFGVLQTGDVDEAHRELENQLSAHRMQVMGRRERPASVNRVAVGATSLLYVDYGAPVRVRADPLDDHVVIMMPVAHGFCLDVGDQLIAAAPGRAVVVPCRAATRFIGEPEINTLVIKVGIDEIARHLHQLAPATANHIPVFEAGKQINPALLAGAVHGLHSLYDLGYDDPPPLVQRELLNQLVNALLFGCRHSALDKLMSPPSEASRERILRAVELIEEAPAADLTLADVTAAVGVGARALQEGFRRHLGISPGDYIRRSRLQRVRAVLLAADPEGDTTVTDVAMDHGFTHLGRFATQYREAFGETPSTTLKAAPDNALRG